MSSKGFLIAENGTPTYNQNVITATTGQTVFTTPTSYTPGAGQTQVFLNGLKLLIGYDYTETTATSITLTSGVQNGAQVSILVSAYATATTNSGVIPGTYSAANVTIGADGRITNAASGVGGKTTIVTFGAGSSGTWTCPAGVTSVQVRLQGAGGGGFPYIGYTYPGGAGAFIEFYYPVTPGSAYSYAVGSGGNGATTQYGATTAGGNTTFVDWVAGGGSGAAINSSTPSNSTPGNGGTVTTGALGTGFGLPGIKSSAIYVNGAQTSQPPDGFYGRAIGKTGWGYGDLSGTTGGGGPGILILEY